MIENILYEIDNAFNESENNVLEAIQESCYKALEILENSSDDIDVSCFGVFQEAAVAVAEPIKRNKITRNVNVAKAKEDDKKKAEAEKNKNKEDNKKDQKDAVVINTPKVEKALSEVRKKKTEENLSKLATVNARQIEKIHKYCNDMIRLLKSKYVKAFVNFRDNIFPNYIKDLIVAFKSVAGKGKHVQEAAEIENDMGFFDFTSSKKQNDDAVKNAVNDLFFSFSDANNKMSTVRIKKLVNETIKTYFTNESGEVNTQELEKLLKELGEIYIGINNKNESDKNIIKKTMVSIDKSLHELNKTEFEIDKLGKAQQFLSDMRYNYKYDQDQHAKSSEYFDKASDALQQPVNLDNIKDLGANTFAGIIEWLTELLKFLADVVNHPLKTLFQLKNIERVISLIWSIIKTIFGNALVATAITVTASQFPVFGAVFSGIMSIGDTTSLSLSSGVMAAVTSILAYLVTGAAKKSFGASIKMLVHGFIEKFCHHLKPYTDEVNKIITDLRRNNPFAKGE